jgi:hypothetical protein
VAVVMRLVALRTRRKCPHLRPLTRLHLHPNPFLWLPKWRLQLHL